MRLLNNMKVRSKLVFLMAVMVVVAIAVGATGVVGLLQTDKLDAELYEHQTQPLATISQLVENLLIASSSFDMAILGSDDAAVVEQFRADVERLNGESAALIAEYSADVPPEAQQAFADGKQIFEDVFVPTSPKVFEQLQAGNVEEADAIMGGIDVKIGEMVDDFNACKAANVENAGQKRAQNDALSTTLIILQIVIFAVGLVLVVVIGLLITASIARPMRMLASLAGHVGATGELQLSPAMQAELTASGARRDEFGETNRSFGELLDMFRQKAAHLDRIADCDLTGEVELKSAQDNMGLSLQKMSGNLNGIFAEIKSAADQVAAAAGQISHSAQDLASGSTQQAASVEEFSASLAGVAEKVEGNAGSARQSLSVTNHAGELMQASMGSMSRMLEAMRSIDESSQSIKKVIKVIDDIAFQTNILALNAAVEAARAGQHGKGFAVVADEVRNLAAKSAEAAKETAGLIEGSSQRVQEGNQIVERTNEGLLAVGASAQENLVLIQGIVENSDEQTQAIAELNLGIGQISAVVQSNSATAEESAAAAQQMNAQAAMLQHLVERFRLQDSGGHGYRGLPAAR